MTWINDLTVIINNQPLLKNVSCSLKSGRISSFIGKSGAGKTTLLKTIVGLTPASTGEIFINGNNGTALSTSKRAQEIGYVFQNFNLFAHLTVLQNCIDPLIVHGSSRQEAEQKALCTLQEFDMADYAQKYPHELSGGQQQRVAIARALCLNPRILLLDEPTASLDPANTATLAAILKKLAAQGLTIALSSQDMPFVRMIFDCVYYIENGTIIEYCEKKEKLNECTIIKKWIYD